MFTEKQVHQRHSNGDYTLKLTCVGCNQEVLIRVKGKEMFELQTSSKLIQNILPNHTPDEREMFISQICGVCWQELVQEDEGQQKGE
jgi:hypothetical protein